MLVDTTALKMKNVLSIERRLQDQMRSLSSKDILEAAELPFELTNNIEDLVHTIYSGSEDHRAIDAYFAPVLDWTLPLKKIIERDPGHKLLNATADEKLQISHALTSELPNCMGNMESIYMPYVNDVLRLAKLASD
ncbi:hypothetical protein K4F52_008647 [Lecanicillium sp. MT-2017a]|nr:hypothetical protein K4F52_008647 [Lecanicillium sp. MT-2017a]